MNPFQRFRKELNELPPIKKVMLVLTLVLGVLLIDYFGSEQQQPVAGNEPQNPAGLDAAAAPPDAGSPVATGTGPTIALPTTTGVISQPLVPMALDGGQTLTTPKDAGARTIERQAADAVAEGKFGTAIQLYDQLAATTPAGPEQDAYRAAAQILRQKVDGG